MVAYWQALENVWPKQVPWKLSSTPKTSQSTINFSVAIIAFNYTLHPSNSKKCPPQIILLQQLY